MTTEELISLVHCAYQATGEDSTIEKIYRDPNFDGDDAMARFIVSEVRDASDPTLPDWKQIRQLRNQLFRAADQLRGIANKL